MIGETFSHYRVVEHLGGGGMGVVYKAQDLRLGRTVALKFLPPELSRDDDAIARFRNEARAASALDHPSICTIYDIDETSDGRLFIAMALCEGATLKRRLAAGPLDLLEALRIARHVAEALAQAHHHGIVHRDIKPANLIVTPHAGVKVVDFGIAKLADSPAVTRTGESVGTPFYMSPEQIQGAPVDSATDLWSLGAVLYEMITGRPPFAGSNATAVATAILGREPPSIESLRPGTPPMVVSIVRRLLTKDRTQRYDTAAEVSEDLRAAEHLITGGGDTSRGSAIGAPPDRRPLIAAIALLSVALVAAVILWTRGSRAAPPDASVAAAGGVGRPAMSRIAVLPFTNLGSADDEFFAAGMTEEISSRLAGVSRLGVLSSTTVTQYDRQGKNVRQIGGDLGVDYIVEGTVRWAGGGQGSRVLISPKLVRVADDTAIWSDRYETPLSDVFKVQSEIAYRITGALQVALEARERRAFDARPTSNDEAYLEYLRGMAAFQHGTSNTNRQFQARTHLERAVAIDSRFALAWSLLSEVLASQYGTGARRTPETLESGRGAARRALDLEPGLPEAHLAQARMLLLDGADDRALSELEVARAGRPNSPSLFRMLSVIERRRGNWAASLSALTRGFEIDPATFSEYLAAHYLFQRDYPEAFRFIGIARTANSTSIAVPEAWALFCAHQDIAGARRGLGPVLTQGSPPDARALGLLARLEFIDGRHDRALEIIRDMDAAGAWLPPDFRFPAALAEAQVYEAMNRRAEAIERYRAAAATLETRRRETPNDHKTDAALGLAYAGLGRAADAVSHGERAVALLPISRDAWDGPLYVYLLAQIYARVGRPADAFAKLDELFKVPGFYNVTWIERDPGFVALRAQPKYRDHVARWSNPIRTQSED